MTLSKKPILDEEGLRNSERPSELDLFLDGLFFRTNALLQEIDDGKLNREIVCFETLLSAFSALDEGRSHEEIKTAWRITCQRRAGRKLGAPEPASSSSQPMHSTSRYRRTTR